MKEIIYTILGIMIVIGIIKRAYKLTKLVIIIGILVFAYKVIMPLITG